MTAPPTSTSAGVSHAPGAPPSSPNHHDSNVDDIVSSLEEPSLGQLLLFKSVFGVGISLARYIVDNPLWSILAAAGWPCPTCIRATAMIKSHLCLESALAIWLSLIVSWRSTETRSTNPTSDLLKLNPLDDKDQRELNHQELWEFRQRQLLVPGPLPSVPHTSSLAGDSSLLPRAPTTKKQKRLVKVDSGSTPKCRRPEQSVDRLSPIAPTVPQVEGGSDYRCVVVVLHPPHVPGLELPTLLEVGHLVPADSSHRLVHLSSSCLQARWRIFPHSEVDAYKEVAKRQKQEIRELCKQVDDATSRSSNAYAESDSANARALCQRDHLEELEEMVCQYWDRAHVAKGLIRQYPEDEGLLHHTPERLSSIVDFVLGYLSQACFTPGELHLRSMSCLLYYYSNAADWVEGLYQEMLTHSRFPSHNAFLTAAQHAGYVDARPGTLEPPLHGRFFSFDHSIPILSSPTSDHLPAIPALDSIMVSWEHLIANYIHNMIDTPGPHYLFPTLTELPDVGSGPSLLEGSVLAEGAGENDPREVAEVAGETGVAVCLNVTTPTEEGDRDLPVGGLETSTMAWTPLLLPASRSPSSPLLFPSVPVVPNIIDLTMVDDNGEDLYESHEEFEARMQGDVAVKNERSSPAL
ncbi:hypothetical protein GG344DRAFT_83023 [Lentinula edodes]|nr:hypothetical protein GG344DRAFT_83023 [Lentinula edodes]